MGSLFSTQLNSDYARLREKNPNLSKRAFARYLGLAPSTVHQYLTDTYRPTSRNLQLISMKLKWSHDLILKIDEELNKHYNKPETVFIPLYEDERVFLNSALLKVISLDPSTNYPGSLVELSELLHFSGREVIYLEIILADLKKRELIDLSNKRLSFLYNIRISPKTLVDQEYEQTLCRNNENIDRFAVCIPYLFDSEDKDNVVKEFNKFITKMEKKYSSQSIPKSTASVLFLGIAPMKSKCSQ